MKYTLELIRLIAVILITFTHTKHNFTDGIAFTILEEIPKYGTLILSLISGFLWQTVSRHQNDLFTKKVKSLLIPYLIANLAVLIPVLVLFFVFQYDILNRLSFDYTLISEGIFALNTPPVNPPTYFVRDIFIIFVLIEFALNKNFKMLFILIPVAIFGQLLLRFDILGLFLAGALTPFLLKNIKKTIILSSIVPISVAIFLWLPEYFKYPVVFFSFILVVNIDIKFIKTGNYTYLLHLYHSPVMVASFPIISKFVPSPYPNLLIQLALAFLSAFLLTLLTRKIKPLRILNGGR